MDPVARIGEPAPDFTLRGLDGDPHRLADQRGRTVVLNFWSAECPHSVRADEAIAELSRDWGPEVVIWRIASNANEPAGLLSEQADRFPAGAVLRDPDLALADQYGASATPHLFVIGPDGVLDYAGGLDDVGLRRQTPTRHYLAAAVAAIRSGSRPDPPKTPTFGCALVRHPIDGGPD